jgi:hypothetical protein
MQRHRRPPAGTLDAGRRLPVRKGQPEGGAGDARVRRCGRRSPGALPRSRREPRWLLALPADRGSFPRLRLHRHERSPQSLAAARWDMGRFGEDRFACGRSRESTLGSPSPGKASLNWRSSRTGAARSGPKVEPSPASSAACERPVASHPGSDTYPHGDARFARLAAHERTDAVVPRAGRHRRSDHIA